MSLLDQYRTTVVVLRGGGRDNRGNPLPTEDHVVEECLPARRSTEEPIDRSDLTRAEGVLYRRRLDFDFHSSDRVRIPEGTWLTPGVWAVEGEPSRWPAGWEVPLRKEP